ncbi:MAG: PAS domain S-box protein, partial [Coriobacteriia bacterium]
MPDESSIQVLRTAVDPRVAMTAVLENTPVLTALLDRDLTFIWANRAYAAACGRTPESFAGQRHFELYPNAENEAVFRKVVASGLPAYVESKPFRYPDQPDRGLTHWDWSVVPLFDPNGNVMQVVFTLMDVTERTRNKMSADLIGRLHQSSAALTRIQVLVEALDGVCELLESPVGFFHSVESDETTVEMQVWSTKTQEHFCAAQAAFRHCDLDQAGVWADCLRQRKAVIHNDYDSLTHKRGMPKGHAKVTRELVVPVFRGERIVAILGIGNRPQDYNESDITIVAHAADAAWEIADRIRASDELAASEDRYRRSIELFPEPVYMNRDGRFVYVNSACVQLLGARDAQELIGTPIMDRIAPSRRQRARRRIEKLLETHGNAPLEETVFVRMDGSPVDVEVTATVFDASDGPLVEVVLRDVTERKRALRALEHAQGALLRNAEKLEQAQRVARLGWYSVDLKSGRWESSAMLDSILGIDASFRRDFGGWLSAIHPDERHQMASLLRRVVQSDVPLDVECRVVHVVDGTVRHVHALGRIVYGQDARLMGTVQDVTERQRARQAILESQERYKVLVEQSPSPIFINRDNKIDLVNHACVELFQAASPDELLGRSIFDLFHPEDHEIIADRARRIRCSGAPLPATCERIVRLDGEVRHVEVSAAPFKEDGDTLIHVVLRDTTEKRKADLEIRRHQQKL